MSELRELLRRVAERPACRAAGQTMVEYGLILVLMVLVVVAILTQLGQAVIPMFSSAAAGF